MRLNWPKLFRLRLFKALQIHVFRLLSKTPLWAFICALCIFLFFGSL